MGILEKAARLILENSITVTEPMFMKESTKGNL